MRTTLGSARIAAMVCVERPVGAFSAWILPAARPLIGVPPTRAMLDRRVAAAVPARKVTIRRSGSSPRERSQAARSGRGTVIACRGPAARTAGLPDIASRAAPTATTATTDMRRLALDRGMRPLVRDGLPAPDRLGANI